jgi:diguanylate cyclase (GGDEF)-like protein/PAS domain S-box-containing protein
MAVLRRKIPAAGKDRCSMLFKLFLQCFAVDVFCDAFCRQVPMPVRTASTARMPNRWIVPAVVVTLFVLVMSGCVLGLVIWKALDARKMALAQSQVNLQNLVHSLAEHAAGTIQAADIAMGGIVELLKFQNPVPERLDSFLVKTIHALPQLREISVFDATGQWKYSSLADKPRYGNADRSWFIYHRDTPSATIRISEPLKSRLTGRSTIILSKRISNQDGSFNGVLAAAIDSEYFTDFYGKFQLGPDAGISLLRRDGVILERWPSIGLGRDLADNDPAKNDFSKRELFQTWIKMGPTGYYKLTSPFDGLVKYLGFEQTSQYPLVLVVALPEQQLLAAWRKDLQSDVLVALVLMCSVILLAALLAAQFAFRIRMENALREREARYRLLADNIADIVILLGSDGELRFVSQSVEPVLGLEPQHLIGTSCFDLVHPDDAGLLRSTTAQLTEQSLSKTVMFRTFRADGSLAWLEANFKRATAGDGHDPSEVVGILRDVTQRMAMEKELTALNTLLAELATTDGLTGLANRRTLDVFLRREYQRHPRISVLLLDIDHFKGFNDSLGHQAGDECLKSVAAVVAEATMDTTGLSTRYGGEEFAIILPDVSEDDALEIAESVRFKVRALQIANPAVERGFLSVSVGIASRTPDTLDQAELVGDADRALYEAKRRGRNCSVTSSSLALTTIDAPPLQHV